MKEMAASDLTCGPAAYPAVMDKTVAPKVGNRKLKLRVRA